MRVFRLDGGTHAVEPEDIAIFEATEYCWWISENYSIEMFEGDTITFTFHNLAPGEVVKLVETRFFRPMEDASHERRSVDCRAD